MRRGGDPVRAPHRRLGRLEGRIGLSEYLEGAIKLEALVTRELLISLFWPHNPTHDGAVIIQGDRVGGAGRLLPLSKNPNLDPTLGTRHRAAVGLSEQTDAVVLVVSESTGRISLARGQAASGAQPRGSAPAPGGPDGNSRRRKRNLD